MKHILKTLTVLICIIATALSSVNVYCDNEKLYEKYEYQEDFEYEDEIIAHALKTSVPKIFLVYSATLEYKPVTFNSELLEEQFMELYEELYYEYSAEEIAAALVENLQSDMVSYLKYSNRSERVDTEGAYSGSGVVISEDGYIATNAHVANLTEDNKLEMYLSGLQEKVYDDLTNVLQDLEEYGVSLDDSQIEMLYYTVLEDAATKADIIDEDIQLKVCFPTSSGDTSLESAIIYDAEIVEEGTQGGKDGLTQDMAILKIDADNLVALKLSDSYPELNSKIVSAGFPSASDMAFQNMGSHESVLSVTVGTGQVARLIPIDGSDYQAIEITTTISGGNSGGPSVDSRLNIEGLNTYSYSADTRYAYMISAEYVAKMAEQFDVYQGEASKTFLLGLQMLQQDYGKTALECFERVAELRPDIPYIEKMIELAENAPDNAYIIVEDPTETTAKNTIAIILLAVSAALLIIAIVIIIVTKSKNKKKRIADAPPMRPTPPPAPQTPPAPRVIVTTPPKAPSDPLTPTMRSTFKSASLTDFSKTVDTPIKSERETKTPPATEQGKLSGLIISKNLKSEEKNS